MTVSRACGYKAGPRSVFVGQYLVVMNDGWCVCTHGTSSHAALSLRPGCTLHCCATCPTDKVTGQVPLFVSLDVAASVTLVLRLPCSAGKVGRCIFGVIRKVSVRCGVLAVSVGPE